MIGGSRAADSLRPCPDESFVGRGWALDHVDGWLAGEDPSLLITGAPGAGKTALALRLAAISGGEVPAEGRQRLRPGAVIHAHFCRALDSAALDPLRFVESLARRLAEASEPFARELLRLGGPWIQVHGQSTVEHADRGARVVGVHIETLRIGDVSAALAFERLVRWPLANLAQDPGGPLVLLVDALDEALTLPGEETIVSVLADALRVGALSRSLRLLLTSRPDPRVLSRVPGPRLELLDDAPDTVADVRRYAEVRLSGRADLAARVASASAGNFLYARFVLDDLLADPERLGRIRPDALPAGLDTHYEQYIERELARTTETWEERYRPLLGLLTVARGDGITVELLAGAAGMPASRVGDALRRLAQYLRGPGAAGAVAIYHESFRDFLVRSDTYHVYPEEAEKALAEYLIGSVATRGDGNRDWSRVPGYVRAHLAAHAAAAGRLDELLADPAYLVAADPMPLLSAMRTVSSEATARTRMAYRHVADLLRDASSPERAAYLEMAARRIGAEALADRIAQRHPDRPWSVSWARWHRASEHVVVGRRHSVIDVAVAEIAGSAVAVSASQDGALRLWDLAAGGQIGEPLVGHEWSANAVTVTELEDRVIAISGGDDGTLRVWDLAAGGPVGQPLAAHRPARSPNAILADGGVQAVAAGKLNGRTVAVTGGDDGLVRVWDVAAQTPLRELQNHERGVRAVAVTELEGRAVAVTGCDLGAVCIWDLETGAQVRGPLWKRDVVDGQTLMRMSPVTSIAITDLAGCPVAVCGGGEGRVRVWDLANGSQIGESFGALGSVRAVAVAELASGPIAAVGSAMSVTLWDLTTGAQIDESLEGHSEPVTGVAVADLEGGPVVVSGAFDGTVRVWDLVADPPASEPLLDDLGEVCELAVGAIDDRLVAIALGWGGDARILDPLSGAQIGDPLAVGTGARAAWLGDANGRAVALTASSERGAPPVQAWDLDTGAPVGEPLSARNIREARVAAFGELRGALLALIVDDTRAIALWNLADGRQIGRPLRGDFSRRRLGVGEANGRPLVASGDDDNTVSVWDVAAGTRLDERFIGDETWALAVSVGEFDGMPTAVAGCTDGVLRAWRVCGPPVFAIDIGSRVTAVALGHGIILAGTAGGMMAVRGSSR